MFQRIKRAARGGILPETRRSAAFLMASAFLAACGSPSQPAPAPYDDTARDARPHVVMIIMDTLRADVLGSYGYDINASPELDALAAKGAVFDQAISQCSWTRPSIASMITGLYPRTLGLYKEENEQLDDRHQTLAELLKAHGYHTIGVTANPNLNTVFNMHQGFDHYVDSHAVFNWMDKDDDQASRNQTQGMTALDAFEHADQALADAPDAPVYLQINIMEMHDYKRRAGYRLTRPEFGELYPEVENTSRRLYLQALRQTSIDVTAFIESMSARDGWGDAVFVLVSDHGEGLDSHEGIRRSADHGRFLYESHLRVPLIIYSPGRAFIQSRVEELVPLLDLAPTILDLVGAERPESMQGHSLLPRLNEAVVNMAQPNYVISETEFRDADKTSVYGLEWAYYDHRDGGIPDRGNLLRYELQARGAPERGKHTDVSERHADVREAMAAYLAAWEAEHLRVPPTPMSGTLSDVERSHLEAIGYLE